MTETIIITEMKNGMTMLAVDVFPLTKDGNTAPATKTAGVKGMIRMPAKLREIWSSTTVRISQCFERCRIAKAICRSDDQEWKTDFETARPCICCQTRLLERDDTLQKMSCVTTIPYSHMPSCNVASLMVEIGV